MPTIPLNAYLTWLQSQTTGRVQPLQFTELGAPAKGTPETSPGETGQGSSPESSDQSTGGRIGLAAELDNTTSPTNITLGIMGTLAGPIGSLVGRALTAAMASHNQSALTAGLRGEQGPRLSAQRISEARVGLPDPTDPTSADDATTGPPSESEGPNPDDTGLTGPTGTGVGAAPAGSPAGGVGNPSGGNPSDGDAGTGPAYHGGGPVRDRRPGMDEPITAQQGEFVVARGPAKKFRGLLEAINESDVPEIKRQARTLKEAMTR